MLPRSPFKSDAQVAEEKRKSELNARWNRVEPEAGVRLVPRKPAKDAKEMTKRELSMEWSLCKRERVKDGSR